MRQVVDQYETDTTAVPFAMLFASQPSLGDAVDGSFATMTTTYSTDCGPSNSPDDGELSSKDDD